MLQRIWEAFTGWGLIKRGLLLLVAPWLVLLAWMVTTGKPRWATGSAVAAVGLMWVALVAGAAADEGSEEAKDGAAVERAAETEQTTTVPQESTTTTTERVATTTTTAASLTVIHITDGDTLDVSDGRTVRLAQVDAPERGECYGDESTAALKALADGKTVELRRPTDGPEKDKYGRTLADVIVDGQSVNETLVTQGAAEWYEEFASEDADLASRLQAAEAGAKTAGRGLWAACYAPPTTLPPTTVPPATAPPPPPPTVTTAPPAANCHPSYRGACVPAGVEDVDCAGGSGNGPYYVEGPVEVVGPDEYGLDADHDGIGCES